MVYALPIGQDWAVRVLAKVEELILLSPYRLQKVSYLCILSSSLKWSISIAHLHLLSLNETFHLGKTTSMDKSRFWKSKHDLFHLGPFWRVIHEDKF